MRTPTNPSPPCDAIKLYGMIESSPHTDACHARWNDTWFLHRNFILSACCRAHSVLRCSCDTATRRIPEVSTFGAVISWTSSKALKIDNHVDRTGVWPAEGGRREYGGAGAGGGGGVRKAYNTSCQSAFHLSTVSLASSTVMLKSLEIAIALLPKAIP